MITGGTQALHSGGDGRGFDLWWLLLLLLLPLVMIRALCCRRRKRTRSELLREYTDAPPLTDEAPKSTLPPTGPRPPPLRPPPVADTEDELAPPVRVRQKPEVRVRPAPQEAPREPAVTEIKSKFRWGVVVGHYIWRGGGGAAAPMNVGWGSRGATSSVPIVVNEMVTLEGGAGMAPQTPQAALASKKGSRRVICRSMGPSSRESARDVSRISAAL